MEWSPRVSGWAEGGKVDLLPIPPPQNLACLPARLCLQASHCTRRTESSRAGMWWGIYSRHLSVWWSWASHLICLSFFISKTGLTVGTFKKQMKSFVKMHVCRELHIKHWIPSQSPPKGTPTLRPAAGRRPCLITGRLYSTQV